MRRVVKGLQHTRFLDHLSILIYPMWQVRLLTCRREHSVALLRLLQVPDSVSITKGGRASERDFEISR